MDNLNNLVNITDGPIEDRVIEKPLFNNHNSSRKLTKLSDPVVTYNDGMHWKAIDLKVMSMYPVIHDTYFEDNKPLSIYVCPFSLFGCTYFDTFVPIDKEYNSNLVLVKKDDRTKMLIPILGKVFNLEGQGPKEEQGPVDDDIYVNKRETITVTDTFIRKGEVKVMTLRNAISLYPDILFLDTQIMNIKKVSELGMENLVNNPITTTTNKYQPYQIIYIIEYHSKKQGGLKYTIIIPKINTFDIVKNKFWLYFNKMIDKIRDKGGHIYMCYWFAFNKSYSGFKIIDI
ncbi:MAG: hypothetical protein Barrevirus3_32 [Barrevirus sp.]|uniref:Uncharacterized protein n=1 Tax=Barrevirus sp. TaxID=2487763 RepID=A0A3G4ZPS8_9VIRU|nr:MAG: hypothetical protein Barrevirus3_32 [Barrevirus sp.]